EFLLPLGELQRLDLGNADFATQLQRITAFATPRFVSSTAVAYKLYLAGRVDRDYWLRAANHYRQLWLRSREAAATRDGAQVNYYTIRQHRVGKGLIRQVNRLVSEGSLTETEAAKVLGVRATK